MSERDLFVAALRIADRAEREAYLARVCAGNAGLRRRLDLLLEAHTEMGESLEELCSQDASTDQPGSDITTNGSGGVAGPGPPSTRRDHQDSNARPEVEAKPTD